MKHDREAEQKTGNVEFRLDVHNAHLIRRAHQRATVLFQRKMGNHGLTPTQLAVVGTLYRTPNLPQNELGRLTAIDTATLSAMIRRLEKSDLLSRVPAQRDQRVMLVKLTDKGTQIARELVPLSMALSAELLDPIPEAERGRFIELLTLIGQTNIEEPATKPEKS